MNITFSVGTLSGVALFSSVLTTGIICALGQYLPANLPDSGQIYKYSCILQVSVGTESALLYSVIIWSGGQFSDGSNPDFEHTDT